MAERSTVDQMDQSILRILSAYEQLTALELWFELGEDDGVKENVTEGEILSRLDSLTARGFVERVPGAGVDGDSVHLIFRVKTNTDVASQRSSPTEKWTKKR